MLAYNLVIASLISVSCILLEASSSWLCKIAFQCSHILSAKFHNSKIVFRVQSLPWSFDCKVTAWAIMAAPQCRLRYPCMARVQPICACSSKALETNSCCLSGTRLTSGWGVSGDSSHDLMNQMNSCWTLQVQFCMISLDIEYTSSYHLQCALPAGHKSMCSWVSLASWQRGHLWALTASREIIDFCQLVLSHPWTRFEALIHCSGPRERYDPFIVAQLMLLHITLSQPCFCWRCWWCLLRWMCQQIECWKFEDTRFPLTDRHTLELGVKNPSWIDMTSFWSMCSWKLVASLLASQFLHPQISRSLSYIGALINPLFEFLHLPFEFLGPGHHILLIVALLPAPC
jgi:hypothetical protein